MKRTGFTPASREQREKAETEGQCRVTGARLVRPDAAHVISRAQGGCDDPLCVVPMSRAAHRRYDDGGIDILPFLTLEEQAHAASHVGLLRAYEITTNERISPGGWTA